jgi:hypothetical protein
MNHNIAVLRVRKGVPGVGRMLARELDCPEVTCGYRPMFARPEPFIIFNYGRSQEPIWNDPRYHWLNKPEAVGLCVDKRATFETLAKHNVPTLQWTRHQPTAQNWLEGGRRIFARTQVAGSKGKGIIIVEPGGNVPYAPLYTVDAQHTHEFRVQTFRGRVIDIVQKKRMGREKLARFGLAEADPNIRSYKRGWVFAHKDHAYNEAGRAVLQRVALNATAALGLDFCGVDLAANIDRNGNVTWAGIIEMNSAPGIDAPTTFKAYINAIKEFYNEVNRNQ